MAGTAPKAPKALGPSGRRLWDSVLGRFELEEDEVTLLLQAAGTADLCESLQAAVDRDGPLLDGRVNPAAVELRQQRIVLTRLIVALRVPEDDGVRPQRRGARGAYMISGGAS